MCDPVRGEYIVKGVRDDWKVIPGLRLPEGESLGVSIDTCGVMMLLARTKGRKLRCYLDKHQPL